MAGLHVPIRLMNNMMASPHHLRELRKLCIHLSDHHSGGFKDSNYIRRVVVIRTFQMPVDGFSDEGIDRLPPMCSKSTEGKLVGAAACTS